MAKGHRTLTQGSRKNQWIDFAIPLEMRVKLKNAVTKMSITLLMCKIIAKLFLINV